MGGRYLPGPRDSKAEFRRVAEDQDLYKLAVFPPGHRSGSGTGDKTMCFNFTSKASRTEKSYGPRSRQVKVDVVNPVPVTEPIQRNKKRWR